jgi:peptide/nickel transport system permease protein
MKTKKNEENYEIASQYKLMWLKLKRHKLAMIGLSMLIAFYLILLFCEFLSPYISMTRNSDLIYSPPQKIHFVHEGKFQLRPFVYGYKTERNIETLKLSFIPDSDQKNDIFLFVKGDEYKLWGLFPGDTHLFGVKKGYFHLFGTDGLGRDMLTRVFYGTRVSLSIGMIGLVMTFILGLIMGGVSGYMGGIYDTVIQRVIEFIRSIPTLPLWMALAAALPSSWPPMRIYFGITIILSVIGWTGLARVIRGKLMSLREEDYVLAAKISGASASTIISRHLIPSFLSYIIVSLTLWVPQMILGETALSFIGLGLRAPVVSWGSLLYEARDIHAIAVAPWLLLPALAIFLTVLAFNFLGDGLRDAADPYKR